MGFFLLYFIVFNILSVIEKLVEVSLQTELHMTDESEVDANVFEELFQARNLTISLQVRLSNSREKLSRITRSIVMRKYSGGLMTMLFIKLHCQSGCCEFL